MATRTKTIAQRRLVEESRIHLRTAARRAYAGQKKQVIDNQQIADLLPMVHKVVQRVVTYIKPPLSHEDLVSAGTLGLVRAARDYDPAHKAGFKTYAYIRIRGAVLDELRKWSFVPANVDKQIRKTLEASSSITEQTGKTPSDEELAAKLEISIERNVLRRLEDNGILKSDKDPHSGRSLYSLNITTEETKSVDLDKVFSD